jgi:pimeloyl-ACP methyl ester carboxylesterase
MLFARTKQSFAMSWIVLTVLGASDARAAGVTLITHGNSGNTDGWVTGMANALSQRLGGNVPIYRINVTSSGGGFTNTLAKISGATPTLTATGEIIVMLDWRTLANGSYSTYQVANSVAPVLAQTNLITELNGHALTEFPLHILGHSRGGSLVCELSQRLGELGLWVDQVTALDAYPLGIDAPATGYENVLFAESYYQTDYWLFDGQVIPNSHWRRQTVEAGGYAFPVNWHSDVHLWYHGTIDLNPTASDTEESFTSSMRDTWWTAAEQKGTNAGFIYSRLGGGNRYVTNRPNGSNSSQVRDGINRNFELGLGVAPNRTTLMFNTGDWPNVIRLDLLSTNPVPQGSDAQLRIYYQWAKDAGSSMGVEVWRDADQNPLNGNEQLLTAGTASGTTGAAVVMGTIPVPITVTNVPVGTHRLFVKLSAGNRSRVLYAAQSLQVVAGAAPPWLDIASTEAGVLVGVNGSAGQSVVLENSPDLQLWNPMATNALINLRWELPRETVATNEFFRARLLP